MNSKLQFVMSVLFVVSSSFLSADTLFEPKEGAHLTGKTRVFSEGELLTLPNCSFSKDIQDRIARHNTVFLTEITWEMPALPERYRKPEQIATLLLDVNSLEGIEYWSGGRDKMYPYIKKSYRVDSNGSRSALPPLTKIGRRESVQFIQYQKDTSFGSNWYNITIRTSEDSVLMETVNLSDLTAFTKKTQDAGGVLMQMVIIPASDRTIIYSAVAFKEFPPIGWGPSAVSGSFNHRISAIQTWIANTIFGTEVEP